jgi:hypothetical protein
VKYQITGRRKNVSTRPLDKPTKVETLPAGRISSVHRAERCSKAVTWMDASKRMRNRPLDLDRRSTCVVVHGRSDQV